jgi:hypothetical protein
MTPFYTSITLWISDAGSSLPYTHQLAKLTKNGESTSLTPNMLMLGREVRTPLELQFGHTSEKIVSYGDYVNCLRSKLQMAHDICRRYLAKTAKRRKDIYDAKVCFKSYQPGDAVWYLHEQRKDGVCFPTWNNEDLGKA